MNKWLLAEEAAGGGGDAASSRAMRSPEIGMIRDGGVFGVEALGRGVEEAEPFSGDTRDNFSGDASPWPGFADG